MVVGLDKFREFFKDFANSYIIIGGTACDIILEEAGIPGMDVNELFNQFLSNFKLNID